MSVTHIAGVDITIGTRRIQRCSVCGMKLCDNKNVMVSAGHDRTTTPYIVWPVGRMIRAQKDDPQKFELLPDTGKLPEDSCVELVEA